MPSAKLSSNSSAPAGVVAELRAGAPSRLPESYFSWIANLDGAEGPIDIGPGWGVFWTAGEVLKSNVDYGIAELMPGFFGSASSGGGELYPGEVVP